MNNLKNNRRNLKLILAAIVGIFFIGAYFLLITTSSLVTFLRPPEAKENILSTAESFFRNQPLDHSRFDRTISAEMDGDLLKYIQYYHKKEQQYPDLTPGYWSILWRLNDRDEANWRTRFFQIRYDFSGNLVGFTDNTGFQAPGDIINDIPEEDALFEAKYFLGEYGIKTSSLVVANREILKKGDKTQYKFVLENKSEEYPGLLDQYSVELLGSRVTAYRLDRVIDREKIKVPNTPGDEGVAAVLMVITWVVIIIALVVRFIKKLRKDELEFKRGLWMGIGLGLVVFVLVAVNAWHEGWIPVLLGGGLSALFILLGMLVLLPIAESQGRAVWPEKLVVTDLLFQGKLMIRETGAAVLRAFFLGGVILLLFGLLVRAVTTFNIGYVSFDRHIIDVLHSPTEGISVILKNVLYSAFLGLSIFSFWPAFLKEKLRHNAVLLVLLTLSFSLGGLQFMFFNPHWLALLLVLPIAFTWSLMIYKYDLLTIVFAFMGAKLLLDLPLVLIIPGSFSTPMGMALIILMVLLLLAGIYLLFRSRSAEDYDSYVPEYVNRIAERERLLRELEIARSVQMRFLPQKVPEFPSLEIVSLCQPAMEVGGDYYDFVQISERYMSVLIGDVSGKGVSAAFYMTMVKGIIKTLSKITVKPSELLAEANEIFCENAPRDVFITIIYGIFDLEEKKLTIASAGHNPLIVWKKKTNEIEQVNPRGIALGLEKGRRYREIIEEKTIPFEADDIFVFYTDGVSEAMNTKHDIFGEERLCEAIIQNTHLPPRIIQKKIVEAVSEFSGKEPQHDDFTMVVVKIKG